MRCDTFERVPYNNHNNDNIVETIKAAPSPISVFNKPSRKQRYTYNYCTDLFAVCSYDFNSLSCCSHRHRYYNNVHSAPCSVTVYCVKPIAEKRKLCYYYYYYCSRLTFYTPLKLMYNIFILYGDGVFRTLRR